MNRLSGYFFRPFAAFSYHFRTRRLWRKRQLEGSCQYDVVSCVYNVEKYLEDYFRSLTGQILDFASHIRLIMVDDGSTDGSAERIRKWQSRYPKNIVYIRKENGGINTARNVGLDLAEAPWVTFIDPDDFVDCSYFLHVDAFLREHHQESPPERRMKFLACNYIFYR